MASGLGRPRKVGRVIGRAAALALRAKRASQTKTKLKAGAYMGVSRDSESWDLGIKALQQFPFEMQNSIIKKSGRAAAIIVRETANTMLDLGSSPHGPDEGAYPGNSMMTGTFDKKSYEQQEARAGRASMVDKVGIKPMSIKNGYLHMIGPRRPWGNQAHILEFGGVIELWGTGLYYNLKPRPFMEPAGSNTRGEQQSAYLEKTKDEWANW